MTAALIVLFFGVLSWVPTIIVWRQAYLMHKRARQMYSDAIALIYGDVKVDAIWEVWDVPQQPQQP